jgi:hypothetical protein
MNARNYRINLILSPLDFPVIKGLGQSYVAWKSEPKMIGNKVSLTITKTYVLIDTFINKKYEILSAESIYEIPANEIKTREDVYDFYKDALLILDEAYKYQQTQLPMLPSRLFLSEPIESYKAEIDRVFNLLNSRN